MKEAVLPCTCGPSPHYWKARIRPRKIIRMLHCLECGRFSLGYTDKGVVLMWNGTLERANKIVDKQNK